MTYAQNMPTTQFIELIYPKNAPPAFHLLARDLSPDVSVTAGYRLLEGGADVDDVYNFAFFQYAVASVVIRL